jgi:hypothetical protein
MIGWVPWFLALQAGLFSPAPVTCPAEGMGGDTILNRLKNRALEPRQAAPQTVPGFLRSLTPDLGTGHSRAHFTAAQRAYVEPRERQALALEGYLLDAKQSGPEACNCHAIDARDFHVWLGAQPGLTPADSKALRAGAVVVEPTPAGQHAHPTWRLHLIKKLARDGAKVRVTGWLMYDPEHGSELGKTRGTLWELHPVTRIEVWSGGRWREF